MAQPTLIRFQPWAAALFSVFFCCISAQAAPRSERGSELSSSCLATLSELESLLHRDGLEEAASLWDSMPENCSSLQTDKASRSRVSLARGRILIHRGKVREGLPFLMTALEDKQLATYAALNLSAAYYRIGEPARALSFGKRAAESKDPELRGRAQFNVGLALLQTLSQSMSTEVAGQATQAFTDAESLMPKFGGPAFYQGVIEELVRGNVKSARQHYDRGCTLGFKEACESARQISKR